MTDLKTPALDARGRFRKGASGNPAGRRPGPNKATIEAKAACQAIVNDPTYQKNLLARLRAGTAAPGVECMCWYFAHGKPTETLEVSGEVSLIELVAASLHPKENA